MGSWNATCFITNLPILEDETVYVFSIESEKDRGHSIWSLNPFWYRGVYDGYGAFKPSPNQPIYDQLISKLFEKAILSAKINRMNIINYEEIQRRLVDDNLFINNDEISAEYFKYKYISLIAVKKDVLDNFIRMHEDEISGIVKGMPKDISCVNLSSYNCHSALYSLEDIFKDDSYSHLKMEMIHQISVFLELQMHRIIGRHELYSNTGTGLGTSSTNFQQFIATQILDQIEKLKKGNK